MLVKSVSQKNERDWGWACVKVLASALEGHLTMCVVIAVALCEVLGVTYSLFVPDPLGL